MACDPHLVRAHIAEQHIPRMHAAADVAEDALRLEGIAVILLISGEFPQHRLAQRKGVFRLLDAHGHLGKVPQGFRHVANDLNGRRIAAVDMRRGGADMDDCLVQLRVEP